MSRVTAFYKNHKELAEIVPMWEDLATRSDPNVFYEPAMLLPALKYLQEPGKSPFVVTVSDPHSNNRLLGLFPMVKYKAFQRLPFPHFANWKYKHAFYCAPLIERGTEDYCVRALFDALRDRHPGNRTYCFELVDRESRVYDSLRQAARFSMYGMPSQRAVLDVTDHGPKTLLTGKHRSDLRRREKRFSEQGLGSLTYHFDEGNEDVSRWVNEFLTLEASGWKGQSGTAISCDNNERLFFLETTRALGAAGRLRTTSMRLDGQMVSANCDFLAGDTCFAFKTAYDENHRRLSPGKLLLLRHAEKLVGDENIGRIDSCAQADNAMLNRMYPMRRKLAALLLSRRPSVASVTTRHFVPRFVAAKSRLRRWADQLRSTPKTSHEHNAKSRS